MSVINIRRSLACAVISAIACLASTAASASALNPQPLPPGQHTIAIKTPPDPC